MLERAHFTLVEPLGDDDPASKFGA